MGVHGLWQLLQPAGRPVSLESLEGKVLAVDVSIWLHQTMKGMRDKDGNPLPNAHLQGLFSRVCKLLFYSIKPVFVFDGGVPILKKQTMAVRKERKAEAERESNDIAQKLLRNLVQSNAVKQALSGTSKPPRRVPGVVGRNQEKDIFELAPLQESEKIGLTLNAEEWERDFELQEKWIRDGIATLADAHPDSEEFRSLPMEIQHEILHEIKERNKYHSLTKLTQMPEDSDSFSSYQLKKLMKQSKLSSRIEEVRKEMSSKSAADLTYSMGDDYYGDEVESRRIMSEDAAHYVLIKGLSKRKQEEEADKYELQNRVKLEKVDEDDKFGVSDYKSEKSSPLLYEEPELMSTSSDSDSGIETFVAKRKSKLSSKKPKNKQGILRHKKRQPKNSVPLYRPTSSDSHKNNSLPQNDSVSKDELIEVTINPNAARVEDELFPSSIFHTTDQAEVTEQEEYELPDKNKEYTNATEVLRIDHQVTLPSLNLTTGNKSDVVSREVTGVSDEIIAKRKSILDDIRIQLEKKKRENLSTAADEADSDAVALVPDTCLDTTAVGLDYSVHNTCMDTSTVDLDYSTSGGFFHEESSEDNSSDSHIEGIEAVDGGLDTNTFCTPSVSRTPLSSSTELSVPMCNKSEIPQSKSQSSDAENDLQLAIELSLQTAQQENEKNKVCDTVESFNHSTVSSLSKKESNEYSVGKNTDESCYTNPVVHGSPKKSLSESISPTKSVSRPQPEDLDADDPCETFHTFNEETLFNFNSYLDSERQALMSEQGKQNRLATSVTDQINHEAQELLRLFGIPYVVSPMEAEAQCAFLDITNQTEGTITDDSDIWLFGGRRMYKNFFNQSKYVEMYSMDNIHNHFGLSRDQLINIALLCGSDYTEGIQGVGPVRALEIMAEFPGDGLEGLKMFSKWWEKAKKKASSESKIRNRLKDLKLNSGFPSEAVVWAYLNPKVDESKERFTWGLPEVDLLREFAKIKFGWPKEKTDQSLLPMMKQLTQKQHQRRISSYFQPENFIKKSKIKSQRLKKALDLVKNPKAADVGSCEEDSSEDNGVHIKKTMQVNEEARKKLSKSDESEQDLAVPTKKKLNKSEKVIKIKKKANNTEDKKTQDLCFETSQTSSVESRDVGDNFMLRMTKKVENAKTELSRKQKTEKVKKRTKQDPKTGSVVSKMLVSLDQVRPHRTCGQKMSKKGLKSGVMNLSESSSGESDDQLNSVVSETDEMYNTIGNLKPKSFTKIVEGSQNKHRERFQSIQKSKDLQPDQQLFKSSKETDHKTTSKISNTEDLSQGETKAVSSMPAALAASMIKVDDPENYCRADVSIINKQNLPETLAYLNQRSKQDSLILHQLKGGQSMNAVERRLEADEKKTKVNKYFSSSDDTLTFDDLLGKMDAAVTENQRSSKKRYMCLAKNAHAVQSKSKRIENKIEMAKVSEKMEVSVPKKVGFGSSDESFDDMNRSHNLDVASPSENSFKTKRARQFDQPIGKADDNFSSTKKSDKKNKFRQQMKHLNDSRSIRGHGILPYSGKNEFIRSNAFSGKGKGRGKNRVEVSLSKDEKDHDGDVQGLNEYETLTEADLGSDFSECDF